MKCISGSLSIICDSSGNLSVIYFKVILTEKYISRLSSQKKLSNPGTFFRENPFCSVYRQAGVWKKTITSRNNRLYRI